MNRELQKIERRTIGYWFSDGLVDMYVGGVFLLLAVMLFVATLLESRLFAALLVGIGQPLIIILAIYFGKRIIPALKENFVYHRTGYVEYKPRLQADRRRRMIQAGFTGGLMALLILLLQSLKGNIIWVIAGGLLAVFLVVLAYRTGLLRYLGMAAISILSGMMVSIISLVEQYQGPAFYGIFGLCWLVLGIVSFMVFLNQNARVEE